MICISHDVSGNDSRAMDDNNPGYLFDSKMPGILDADEIPALVPLAEMRVKVEEEIIPLTVIIHCPLVLTIADCF